MLNEQHFNPVGMGQESRQGRVLELDDDGEMALWFPKAGDLYLDS